LEKWEIFGSIVGYGTTGNKDKKTKWIVTVNEKRNLVSHPSSGVALSLEELADLEGYEAWFRQKIVGSAQAGGPTDSNEEEETNSSEPDE
jgi:hypothetical protein